MKNVIDSDEARGWAAEDIGGTLRGWTGKLLPGVGDLSRLDTALSKENRWSGITRTVGPRLFAAAEDVDIMKILNGSLGRAMPRP